MLKDSVVKLDWFGVTIQDIPVYIDQEGCAYDRDMGVCPICLEHGLETKTDYTKRNKRSWYFECTGCGGVYDEPIWKDPEAAFVTCISDEGASNDSDVGLRALYREYHDLPYEEGFVWPKRPTR